jgi:beta propeller repeat protein
MTHLYISIRGKASIKSFISTLITFLVITALLVVPSGALALEQKLNLGGGVQTDPDIFGNTVVWADNRYGDWDIFYYDIPSKIELRLTMDTGNSEKPCIYGNYVVWQDDRNGNWDIYMNDPGSNIPIRVTTDPYNQTSPDIYGPWIVWEDDRNGHYDIYLYDINTHMEVRLTTGTSNQRSPGIFGDTLVYLDDRDGDYDIFKGGIPSILSAEPDFGLPGEGGPDIGDDLRSSMLDVSRITDDRVDQSPPEIWGFNIVWSDERSFNSDIFYFNTVSGEEIRITSNHMDQTDPVLHGNIVLWVDQRNGNGDIYHYDILTKVQKKILSSTGNEYKPAIYDDAIIFVNDIGGDEDVFYSTITESDDSISGNYNSVSPGSSQVGSSSGWSKYRLAIISVVIIITAYSFKSYISKKSGKEEEEEEEKLPTIRDINKLKKKDELVEMCNDLGLNPYGNKKRLRKRLISHIKAKEEEKQKRDTLRSSRESEELETRDARLGVNRRRHMGAGRRGAASDSDEAWTVPANIDFDTENLLWDDGLESSGLIGLEEKYALGMLPDYYYEAVYDAWKEDYLNKHTLRAAAISTDPGTKKVGRYSPRLAQETSVGSYGATPVQETGAGRYSASPSDDKVDFSLDWDDGLDAFGLMR